MFNSYPERYSDSERLEFDFLCNEKRKSYKLIQVFYTLTQFEVYLFVILPSTHADKEGYFLI